MMKFSEIELPSNRKFGYFFTGVFALVGLYFFIENSTTISLTLFVVSALFLAVTLVNADLLLPLNKLWMRFGLLLGMIISPIVLGIIYFGLFTPISLVTRAFGRDELRLKLNRRRSHWKPKDGAAAAPATFKNQY